MVKNHSTTVNGHYVTITGLLVNDVKKQTMLEISSWGKKYYIDFNEYYKKRYDDVFSNIIYIYKK